MIFYTKRRDEVGPTVQLSRGEAYEMSQDMELPEHREWAWQVYGAMVRNQLDTWREYYQHIAGLGEALSIYPDPRNQ